MKKPVSGSLQSRATGEQIPFLSIVIPARNEERFMPDCAASLKALDYPAERLEIIFVDASSTDRTAAIALENGFKVVPNPGLKVYAARNTGFNAARGDIIAFTDADCIFPPDWARNAIRHFIADETISALGGPTMVPENQNSFGRAAGIIFDIAGMAGGTVHRSALGATLTPSDDLPGCNSFYRREALAAVMPILTDIDSNEDVEMNLLIRKKGFRLFMADDLRLYHYKRSSPIRLWRQMHVFAIGRLQLARRYPEVLKPCHLIMGIGIPVALAAWLAIAFANTAAALALAVAVLAATGLFWLWLSFKYSPGTASMALLAAAVFISAWPSGFIREIIAPSRRVTRADKRPY